MHVVLIGSNGQLGTDLLRVLPPDTVGVDYPAFDVRQPQQVTHFLRREHPDWVINCAAQTHVDRCEEQPNEAFAVNATGALNVARAAAAVEANMAYISTDYVFGGQAERIEPYTETDRPAPINVYGASKLAGEHLTLAAQPRSLIVRTSGLYGHAGARGKGGNFVETMLRRAGSGTTVRVVDDQCLSPTSTKELADHLVGLLRGGAQGVYHVTAVDHCSWFEFAQAVFELAGLAADVEPIPSTDYPCPARRPAFSALTTVHALPSGAQPLPSWRAMLTEYLASRTSNGTCMVPPTCTGPTRGA